mmetsp:Transcript_48569/g.155398  ORF Transcript_48569/g.155398 Transcript_48569/m.155398 type:complete len:202 (-) Transcript_48569:514-1119(-)
MEPSPSKSAMTTPTRPPRPSPSAMTPRVRGHALDSAGAASLPPPLAAAGEKVARGLRSDILRRLSVCPMRLRYRRREGQFPAQTPSDGCHRSPCSILSPPSPRTLSLPRQSANPTSPSPMPALRSSRRWQDWLIIGVERGKRERKGAETSSPPPVAAAVQAQACRRGVHRGRQAPVHPSQAQARGGAGGQPGEPRWRGALA